MKISTYEIVKRSYGVRTHVRFFTGTWMDACNLAMTLECENKYDGDYSEQELFSEHTYIWRQMQPTVNVWD